jgi:hypothetical protein
LVEAALLVEGYSARAEMFMTKPRSLEELVEHIGNLEGQINQTT